MQGNNERDIRKKAKSALKSVCVSEPKGETKAAAAFRLDPNAPVQENQDAILRLKKIKPATPPQMSASELLDFDFNLDADSTTTRSNDRAADHSKLSVSMSVNATTTNFTAENTDNTDAAIKSQPEPLNLFPRPLWASHAKPDLKVDEDRAVSNPSQWKK